jgi:hypothetical protein
MQRTHGFAHLLRWFLVAAFGFAFATPLQAEQPVTLETVLQGWRDRQDRVKSVRIQWTEHETVPQGSLSDFFKHDSPQQLEAMGIRPGAIIPPRDATYDVACSVVLDGDKIRVERQDHQWSGQADGFVTLPFVSVFDSKVGKTTQTAECRLLGLRQAFNSATPSTWMGPTFELSRLCTGRFSAG